MHAGDSPKNMFFSLGAKVMVTYDMAMARILHPLPLVLGLSMPWAMAAAAPARALPPREGLRVAVGGAWRALVGLFGAPAVAGLVGLVRAVITGEGFWLLFGLGFGFAVWVWVSTTVVKILSCKLTCITPNPPHTHTHEPGKPLIWFAHSWVTATIYYPAAFAFQILLYTGIDYALPTATAAAGGGGGRSKAAAGPTGGPRALMAYHILGAAIVNGILSAAATPLSIGLSSVFFLWGAAGVLATPLALGVSRLGALGVGLLDLCWGWWFLVDQQGVLWSLLLVNHPPSPFSHSCCISSRRLHLSLSLNPALLCDTTQPLRVSHLSALWCRCCW